MLSISRYNQMVRQLLNACGRLMQCAACRIVSNDDCSFGAGDDLTLLVLASGVSCHGSNRNQVAMKSTYRMAIQAPPIRFDSKIQCRDHEKPVIACPEDIKTSYSVAENLEDLCEFTERDL